MQIQHLFKQIDAHKTLFYAWFEAMHTRIDLALCSLSETDAITLTKKIHDEIKRIEKSGNRFDVESEINKINRHANSIPVQISVEMYSMLEDCITFNKKTLGAFDITIQSRNNYRKGIQNIILNKSEESVFFSNEDVQIDLCGYLKGYALGKIKTLLSENNCPDALINVGNSSILAIGNHPFGNGWKVTYPSKKDQSIHLFNQCLTSSGNTSEHFHIIHPQTGKYSESTRTISVITECAVIGEVLSTALYVADKSSLETICKNFGINKECLFPNEQNEALLCSDE